jgi:lysozyme family protein
MGDFNISWPKTSVNEAGYANKSKDFGKETWRGISIVHNPDWAGWAIVHRIIAELGITNTLDCSPEILRKIDKALFAIPELDSLTKEMFKRKYWDPLDLDNEPDQSICDTTFDSAVLIGVETERNFIDQARKEADEIV